VGGLFFDLEPSARRGAPGAQARDRVVLWGPGLPIEEIAAHATTIAYDLSCRMTRRVLFVEDDA
jgi:alanine racemase